MAVFRRPFSAGLKRHWVPLRAVRPGSVLIEFAIVALALYLICAAIFSFGQALFVAEALQHTSDIFAHELARTPLPPQETLSQALQDDTVKSTLFNQDDLLIDISAWEINDQGYNLDQYLQSIGVPMINRLLVPLMIMYNVDGGAQNGGTTYLWYPGAVRDSYGNYYISVLSSGNGTSGPTTVPVVEAVSSPDTFPLGYAGSNPSGLVGLRINYAYQSALLSSYTYSVNGKQVSSPVGPDVPPGSHVDNTPVLANEPLDTTNPVPGGLYGGEDHLGTQLVGGQVVRPFQRLISAQSVYRREVFAPDPSSGP